jgi:hypothetical protein
MMKMKGKCLDNSNKNTNHISPGKNLVEGPPLWWILSLVFDEREYLKNL